MTLHIVLYQPEIPPNTGNIIRLVANTGTHLHLIEPLGFSWDDKALRRAGLDYHEWASTERYPDHETFLKTHANQRILAITTKGQQSCHHFSFQDEDMLMFGPESRGLPLELRESDAIDASLRIPMVAQSRSLNLANAVGIVLYEALRQLDYPNLS